MTIIKEELIWFPGIYGGRTEGLWIKLVGDVPRDEIISLVQQRAKEDGEFAIENDLVGDNGDKMRRMMAFVSDEKNIVQCLEHIQNEDRNLKCTVDFVCRDLANASKVMIR